MSNICQTCGMVCRTPTEYHPYAACLMFKACHDGDTVRANLEAVRATPAPGAPAGFKTVPIEPTEDMLNAGLDADAYGREDIHSWDDPQAVYLAMLDAAPGAPRQEAAAVQAVAPTEEEIDRAWEASEAKPGSLHAWRLAVAWTLARAALPPSGAGEKTS